MQEFYEYVSFKVFPLQSHKIFWVNLVKVYLHLRLALKQESCPRLVAGKLQFSGQLFLPAHA